MESDENVYWFSFKQACPKWDSSDVCTALWRNLKTSNCTHEINGEYGKRIIISKKAFKEMSSRLIYYMLNAILPTFSELREVLISPTMF